MCDLLTHKFASSSCDVCKVTCALLVDVACSDKRTLSFCAQKKHFFEFKILRQALKSFVIDIIQGVFYSMTTYLKNPRQL